MYKYGYWLIQIDQEEIQLYIDSENFVYFKYYSGCIALKDLENATNLKFIKRLLPEDHWSLFYE